MKPTQDDIDNEFWIPIPGYETIYEASSLGRIRSIDRFIKVNGLNKRLKQKIKKQGYHRDGYKLVQLNFNTQRSTFLVGRIIGKLFVPNPDNLPEINHMDLDKTNDFYKNLEWVTRLGNMKHAFANRIIKRQGTVSQKHLEAMKKNYKPVYAFNPKDRSILKFNSHKECAASFGVVKSTIATTIIYQSKLRGKYRLFNEPEWQQFKTKNNL